METRVDAAVRFDYGSDLALLKINDEKALAQLAPRALNNCANRIDGC